MASTNLLLLWCPLWSRCAVDGRNFERNKLHGLEGWRSSWILCVVFFLLQILRQPVGVKCVGVPSEWDRRMGAGSVTAQLQGNENS